MEENVPARSADILEVGSRLLADGVELVIMESTSDYWRIWYYLLESLGLAVALVNSSQARQLAGRPKTDRLDCQWLARLAEMGMLRPSFVPPPRVRALRDLTRARIQLVRDRARVWQRLEKLLEGALIKLSSELSSLAKVKTARLILDALADGERDPKALAGLALGTLRARRGELEAALDGMAAGPHHSRLIRVHLDHVALLDRSVAAARGRHRRRPGGDPRRLGSQRRRRAVARPGPGAAVLPADARLAEIPGVSIDLARAIIAETGTDMSVFPTAGHLASWAGLAPVARQSGPRSRKPRKGQGNAYLKNHCTQAANGAAKTSTFLGERHGRLARRIGPNRAKCAVARSILIIVWHLLNDPEARYRDLGPDWHQRKASRDKKIRGHLRGLESLGVDISALTAAG